MQSFYSNMLFQRETGESKLPWDSTITGQCFTDTSTFSRLIVVSQIWVLLPGPLIIFPTQIKYRLITLIYYQITFMLPPKTLLVLLPPPWDSPIIHFPCTGVPVTEHKIMKDKIGWDKQWRGYCSSRHDGKRCYKRSGFYYSMYYIPKIFYFCCGLNRRNS